MDVGPDVVMLHAYSIQNRNKNYSRLSLPLTLGKFLLVSLSLPQPPSSSLKPPPAALHHLCQYSASPKPHRADPEPSPRAPIQFYVDVLT